MAKKTRINQAPTTFRGTLAKGLSETSEISLTGGKFNAGFIKGFAVITRGEALGHGFWVDQDFVNSVSSALQAGEVKSRYTHPSMSSDGLAKGLGRVQFSESSDDIARGELHFWGSAHKSPDGNLAEHVATRAEEDSSSFGASISFMRDPEAEAEFNTSHGAKWVDDDEYWGGGYWDTSNFKSPDPDNKQNLLHTRMAELRGVDIVDDPAANPDGLFCKDPVFEDAQALIGFALGESKEAPELQAFDVDPNRLASFVSRYLDSKGLRIMKTKLNDDPKSADDPKTNEDPKPTEDVNPETEPEKDPTPETSTEESDDKVDAGRKELSKFMEKFGEVNGAKWWSEGIDYATAQDRHIAALKSKNDLLEKKLKSAQEGEEAPVSSSPSDKKTGKGFTSNITIPGD